MAGGGGAAGLEGRAQEGGGPEDQALEDGGAVADEVVGLVGVEGELVGVASQGVEQDRGALGDDCVGGAVSEQEAAWADGGDGVAGAGVGREAGDAGDEGAMGASGDGDGPAEVPADEGDALHAHAAERVERVEDAGATIGEGAGMIAKLGDGASALEGGGELGIQVGGA